MAELFLKEDENGSVSAFPYTLDRFRRDHPGVGLRRIPTDVSLEPYRIRRVTITNARPSVTAYERAVFDTPVRDAQTGAWSVAWIVESLSAPEIDALREGREVYIGEIVTRLRAADRIDDPTMEQWASGTAPDTVKATVLATGVSVERKRAALVALTGASGPLRRSSDAVTAIGATYSISDVQLDAFFGIGGAA